MDEPQPQLQPPSTLAPVLTVLGWFLALPLLAIPALFLAMAMGARGSDSSAAVLLFFASLPVGLAGWIPAMVQARQRRFGRAGLLWAGGQLVFWTLVLLANLV